MNVQDYNLVLNQDDTKKKILDGINLAVDIISPTLGNSSRRILIDHQFSEITASDDGHTILQEISPKDTAVLLGVKIVREVSAQTDKESGDGTTQTAIILRELLKQLLKTDSQSEQLIIKKSWTNIKVRKDIKNGLEKVLKYIEDNKVNIENKDQIRFVAETASNSKEIGEMLADMFDKLGPDGSVAVEEGNSVETKSEVVSGLSWNQGWVAPQFITDAEREESVLKDGVNILVSYKKIQDVDDIKPIADLFREGLNNILIIANDISGAPLNTLVINKMMGNLRISAVKANQIGDMKDHLLDICTATGATLVGDEIPFSELKLEHFGKSERVIVSKNKTILVGFGGNKEKIDERIGLLKNRMKEEQQEYEKNKLSERIAKLTSGVGSIKVGGNTETEIKDKKAKIDDAVGSVKSAMKYGMLPGGGVSFVLATKVLGDTEGEKMLKNAMLQPFKTIMENSDIHEDFVPRVLETGEGYNTETEEWGDVLEMGIVDSAGVLKSALSNAVSMSSVVGNVGGSLVLIRKDDDKDKLVE
ncbi:MAG: chaperonin GroEL [Candidatus Paceibacterota bacterium]